MRVTSGSDAIKAPNLSDSLANSVISTISDAVMTSFMMIKDISLF
jgi:hypothetical protein